MSKGETARLEIEPEWAYGKKGLPESKYPFPLLISVVPPIQVMVCLLMVSLRDQIYLSNNEIYRKALSLCLFSGSLTNTIIEHLTIIFLSYY